MKQINRVQSNFSIQDHPYQKTGFGLGEHLPTQLQSRVCAIKMKGLMLTQIFTLLLIAFTSEVIASPLDGAITSELRSAYPTTQSALIGGSMPIHWIDNDNIIVPARMIKKQAGSDTEAIDEDSFAIYIWNVKQNTYKQYAKLGSIYGQSFFYDHGNISYSLERDNNGNSVQMVGKLGEEKRINFPWAGGVIAPELEASMGPGERFAREPNHPENTVITYDLLPEDGYIFAAKSQGTGTNSSNQNDLVKLYKPEQAQPLDLPILAKELVGGVFSYSDYLKTYILIPAMARDLDISDPDQYLHKNADPYIFYTISPLGKVDRSNVPSGYWAPSEIFPTKAGIFWVSNDIARNHGMVWATLHANDLNIEAGGRLLLKNGKIIKLFDRIVIGAGVSPDGCTIAYAAVSPDPKTASHLTAINLCASKEGK